MGYAKPTLVAKSKPKSIKLNNKYVIIAWYQNGKIFNKTAGAGILCYIKILWCDVAGKCQIAKCQSKNGLLPEQSAGEFGYFASSLIAGVHLYNYVIEYTPHSVLCTFGLSLLPTKRVLRCNIPLNICFTVLWLDQMCAKACVEFPGLMSVYTATHTVHTTWLRYNISI